MSTNIAKEGEAMNCEICGKPLDEESVSASDGVNEAVKVCPDCAESWEERDARP